MTLTTMAKTTNSSLKKSIITTRQGVIAVWSPDVSPMQMSRWSRLR